MSQANRRQFLMGAAAPWMLRAQTRTFDIRDYGARGDGVTLDTLAIQRAIDAAAAAGSGAQVLVRGGAKYLVSTLVLKSAIDFHLAEDAELIVSTNRAHYPEGSEGVLTANGARGLKITGSGNINGRALDFMTGYNKEGEIWNFGPFRPKIFVPRAANARLGKLYDVRVRNVTGRAENSLRINGTAESRIANVRLENVAVTLDRWTDYPGATFDNRPTAAYPGVEKHTTPGISIRYADQVLVRDCRIAWGANRPDWFTHALEAEASTNLALTRFTGEAAHPERDEAILIH